MSEREPTDFPRLVPCNQACFYAEFRREEEGSGFDAVNTLLRVATQGTLREEGARAAIAGANQIPCEPGEARLAAERHESCPRFAAVIEYMESFRREN